MRSSRGTLPATPQPARVQISQALRNLKYGTVLRSKRTPKARPAGASLQRCRAGPAMLISAPAHTSAQHPCALPLSPSPPQSYTSRQPLACTALRPSPRRCSPALRRTTTVGLLLRAAPTHHCTCPVATDGPPSPAVNLRPHRWTTPSSVFSESSANLSV